MKAGTDIAINFLRYSTVLQKQQKPCDKSQLQLVYFLWKNNQIYIAKKQNPHACKVYKAYKDILE